MFEHRGLTAGGEPPVPLLGMNIVAHLLLGRNPRLEEEVSRMTFKSAKSGRFVTKKHAMQSPSTTYKVGTKPKKSK